MYIRTFQREKKKPSWVAKVRHTSSYAPKSFDNFVHRNFQ